MAALTATDGRGVGAHNVTKNTLTASDTFTYNRGTGQRLALQNTTAGGLTPNLVGSAAASVVETQGATVNYAAGLTLASIPATTGYVEIALDTIYGYLAGGTVTITGGTGIFAVLLNPNG